MIVASRAAQGESQQRAAERVDHIGKVEVLIVGRRLVSVSFADRQKPRRGDSIRIQFAWSFTSENVAGDLFANELVEGFVPVERVDHPIAILPGLAYRVVSSIACRVGVASDVEPVASPAFSVGGRL